MSAKSSVKLLVGNSEGRLYSWVAWLTGSKNALKGLGFFAGGASLSAFGFSTSIAGMALGLSVIAAATLVFLDREMGKALFKPKFSNLWSKSPQINKLSAARLFLFGSRDVWFVVALPVFLQLELGWSSISVGTFLAAWIIGYGLIQALAPNITGISNDHPPDGRTAFFWSLGLTAVPAMLAFALNMQSAATAALVIGLILFGLIFAMNSAVHSFLIVSYADADGISLDVGFYYMANAAGRLLGTICSGWVYQAYGISACLAVSSLFLIAVTAISAQLPKRA